MLGLVKTTQRGFQIIEFLDIYKNDCTLQQSSLALYEQPGAGAVWLGVGENRMHLDQALVKSLIATLQTWLDTGSFNKTEGE